MLAWVAVDVLVSIVSAVLVYRESNADNQLLVLTIISAAMSLAVAIAVSVFIAEA